jgi:hypothetical protein
MKYWEDSTNVDQRYARNRLRLSVFPELVSINQQAIKNMSQASELLRADGEFLDAMAQRTLQDSTCSVHLVPTAAAQGKKVWPSLWSDEGSQQQQGAEAAAGAPGLTGSSATLSPGSTVAGVCAQAAGGADCAHHTVGSQQDAFKMTAFAINWELEGCQCSSSSTSGGSSGTTIKSSAGSSSSSNLYDSSAPSVGGILHEALPLRAVAALPVSLARRVLRGWLSRKATKHVTFSMLSEVLRLVQHGTHSSKTSTLWGAQCVLLHRRLLLLVDDREAELLLTQQLAVEPHQASMSWMPDDDDDDDDDLWLQADSGLLTGQVQQQPPSPCLELLGSQHAVQQQQQQQHWAVPHLAAPPSELPLEEVPFRGRRGQQQQQQPHMHSEALLANSSLQCKSGSCNVTDRQCLPGLVAMSQRVSVTAGAAALRRRRRHQVC